jgi:hypothetical protein
MNLREWEMTRQDPLLKKAFKDYCLKKDISIFQDGSIWLEAGGCIALYDWRWSDGANLDYTEILKEYDKVKNNVELS